MFKEKGKVTEVTKQDDYYYINMGSVGFGLEVKYGVEPKVGDEMTLHTHGGCSIRGMDLNGKKIFYKTDAQLEVERQEWLEKHEKAKQAAFKKAKARLDKQYDKLPKEFKERIDRFRENNPRFRVDYESYEMFCCTQAVEIAKKLKTKEKVEEFQNMDWEKQQKAVPKLSDGHSGNTFGCACVLAYWYLEQPDVISKMHGSLSPLVGSDEFGDNDSLREEKENT